MTDCWIGEIFDASVKLNVPMSQQYTYMVLLLSTNWDAHDTNTNLPALLPLHDKLALQDCVLLRLTS